MVSASDIASKKIPWQRTNTDCLHHLIKEEIALQFKSSAGKQESRTKEPNPLPDVTLGKAASSVKPEDAAF